MPAPVTRTHLRARIRDASRQTNTNGFLATSTLDALITEGVNELYDLLIVAHGADYYTLVQEIPLVVGQDLYPLEADFYRLTVALIGTESAASTVEARAFENWRDLPRLFDGELARSLRLKGDNLTHFRYQLTGIQPAGASALPVAQVRLAPTPRIDRLGLRLHYIPVCAHAELSDGDTVDVRYDGINGWEAYVVAHCVALVCDMQEIDPRYWLNRKAEVRARIDAMAGDRDQAQPFRITDRLGRPDHIDREIWEDLIK